MSEWYYQVETQIVGPVDEAELRRLFASGAIGDETPVSGDGGATWGSYRQAGISAGRPAGESEPCSQCGRVFPATQLLRFKEGAVCAECKPVFLQRLKEGASVTGGVVFGGFWIRVLARLVDGVLLWVVNTVFTIPIFILAGVTQGNPEEMSGALIALTCGLSLLQMLVAAGYEIFFLGRYAATPGKMVCRLKVRRTDGADLSWGRATGRYFGYLLSGFTLGIGYVIAAFDDQKRALHDHICDTRVVKAP